MSEQPAISRLVEGHGRRDYDVGFKVPYALALKHLSPDVLPEQLDDVDPVGHLVEVYAQAAQTKIEETEISYSTHSGFGDFDVFIDPYLSPSLRKDGDKKTRQLLVQRNKLQMMSLGPTARQQNATRIRTKLDHIKRSISEAYTLEVGVAVFEGAHTARACILLADRLAEGRDDISAEQLAWGMVQNWCGLTRKADQEIVTRHGVERNRYQDLQFDPDDFSVVNHDEKPEIAFRDEYLQAVFETSNIADGCVGYRHRGARQLFDAVYKHFGSGRQSEESIQRDAICPYSDRSGVAAVRQLVEVG